MPEPAVFRRVNRRYVPVNEAADRMIGGTEEGVSVVLARKQVRSPQQLALYWAMIGLVYRNMNDEQRKIFPSTDHLSDEVKTECGFYDKITRPDGSWYPKPRSIAKHNTPQDEFNIFMDAAVNVFCTKIIPGMDSDDLWREVNAMLGRAGG